jgi:hypothetical protein
MNKDEIIRMAWKTGLVIDGYSSGNDDLFAFANLVAAHEREACAKWLDFYDGPNGRRAEAIRARGNT